MLKQFANKGPRRLSALLCLLLMLMALAMPAAAEDAVPLVYELTVEGASNVKASTGDVITVTFRVLREDGTDESYLMRALQNEIVYDQEFFEYVDGSVQVKRTGGSALFQTRTDGTNIIKASYLSEYGGDFRPEEVFCTFQLKVVAQSGSGQVKCDAARAKAYDSEGAEFAVDPTGVLTVSCDWTRAISAGTRGLLLLILLLVLVLAALMLVILALVLQAVVDDPERRKRTVRTVLIVCGAVLIAAAAMGIGVLVLAL